MDVRQLEQIVKHVRATAETYWLSGEVDADEGMDEYFRISRDNTLCGCCAIASGMLMYVLQENGHSPVFNITQCHAYVTLGKYILDPTFSQFVQDEPYIVMSNKAFGQRYGTSSSIRQAFALQGGEKHTFTDIESAIVHQQRTGWPPDQTIPKHVHHLITVGGF